MTTPASREELLAEGRHLHDLALADGCDSGRYRLVPHPADPDRTRFEPGPRFWQTEADGWFQQQIDAYLIAANLQEPS